MQATHLTTKSRRLATAAVFSLLLLNSGLAQATTNAPDTTKPKSNTDDTIVLSPFVVDASKDEGYRATNTLAGSRISTDLKDLAAPITVVTKEFLTDVAAVDINDIIAYTANTEGTRDFTASQSSLGRPTDDVSSNPNTANRIRGLERAEITRDYFATISPGFDSYNLDEVTISRGPNSILAGVGHAGGIINYSPQLAGLTQNKNEVAFRFGSFGDRRATLNSNIVAEKDMLAFRVAGAWSDRGFKQQPAWNKDKRLYLAMTYQPWKKTSIHASFETVKTDANNPNSITTEDSVSQWVALGKPSYDSNSAAPVSSFLWRDGNLPTVMYNKTGTIEQSYNVNTGYYFNQQNLANLPIWTGYRMNSNKYLPLDSLNLQPSLENTKYKNFSVSVDQELVRDLDANISFTHEVVEGNYLNLFRAEYATYDIDVNLRLPNGASNPHYGESYMQFRGLDNKQTDHNTNDVFRGTLTYNLDLAKFNKWLGHHRLTGFYEDQKKDTEHVQYNAFGKSNSGSPSGQEIGYRYYLGGSADSPATTVPHQPGLVSGVSDLYFDATSSTWKTDTLGSYYDFKSDNLLKYKLKSEAVILQSYFWDDRIVGLFGVRRDKNDAAYGSKVNAGSGVQSNFGPSAVLQQDTKTYGVVVHPLKWLSLHYNHSENFYPNAGSVDLLGHTTPAPSGLGKDYGFSLNTLDNKLNLKVNWFEVTAANGAADNANFPLAQWTIPFIELTVMPEIARNAGITYKQAMAPGLIVGDARLQNAYTSDNVSKGLEIELTYNITKNWRVMGQISKQEAKQTNIASGLTAFIEERLAYWKSIPALWTGPATGGSAWGLNQTGQQHWNQFDQYYYVSYKSVDGKPSTQLAKWHASVLTNYTFNDGTLKGFSIGGAARYIEKAIIGNPAITDSSGNVTALDLAHPYYNGSNIAIDAWMGYKMKVYHDRFDLSFQLNGRDLEQSGGFKPILANSDGSHSVYRIIQPRTFYLTTTLGF